MSPLIAAARNPRAESRLATSSVAERVRTKTIAASCCSVSMMRVSASSLWECLIGTKRCRIVDDVVVLDFTDTSTGSLR